MKKLKVLMATAEMAPYAKVGGLADVLGSLPMALKENDCDVRVVMPLYGSIDREKYKLQHKFANIAVPFGGRMMKVNVWQTSLKGVKVYFIESQKYFGQKDIYSADNAERFLFFSQAVLYILPIVKFQPAVVHCHDYHTAMIPRLLKSSSFEYFREMKTVLTIHNLQYQGVANGKILDLVDLNSNGYDVNFMEQGIIYADQITTVSPTYAKEIFTKEFGAGLENLLRKNKDKVSGILNGLDLDFFNPVKDKLIAKKFSYAKLDDKKINKTALQKSVGLSVSDKPLVGLISRFVEQKGLGLITEEIIRLDCQFVFLGTGQAEYENLLKALALRYPDKVSVQTKFDIVLAQMIYAGADIFLMPSRFEPCGLGQMIAMRYGTVPVVRAVGGLADTVIDQTNGFIFKPMTVAALKNTLKRALMAYGNKKAWQKIKQNGMTTDFSWNQSAQKYLELYKADIISEQELLIDVANVRRDYMDGKAHKLKSLQYLL